MKQKPSQWVGIEVSKATLDVYLRPSGEQIQVANQELGIATLVRQLQRFEIQGVILESTGGLELEVAQSLQAAGIGVSTINPRQGRDFAKTSGKQHLNNFCYVKEKADNLGLVVTPPYEYKTNRALG
jgi:transposase